MACASAFVLRLTAFGRGSCSCFVQIHRRAACAPCCCWLRAGRGQRCTQNQWLHASCRLSGFNQASLQRSSLRTAACDNDVLHDHHGLRSTLDFSRFAVSFADPGCSWIVHFQRAQAAQMICATFPLTGRGLVL
eukprot:4625521-Pleurochrysis_carterae.AAC.2